MVTVLVGLPKLDRSYFAPGCGVGLRLQFALQFVEEAPIGALGDDPLTPMNMTPLRSRRRYNSDSGGYTGGLILAISRISSIGI